AQTQKTADTRREPQRGRAGVPRLDGDGHGGIELSGAETYPAAAKTRRALVPAPSQRRRSVRAEFPRARSTWPSARPESEDDRERSTADSKPEGCSNGRSVHA